MFEWIKLEKQVFNIVDVLILIDFTYQWCITVADIYIYMYIILYWIFWGAKFIPSEWSFSWRWIFTIYVWSNVVLRTYWLSENCKSYIYRVFGLWVKWVLINLHWPLVSSCWITLQLQLKSIFRNSITSSRLSKMELSQMFEMKNTLFCWIKWNFE